LASFQSRYTSTLFAAVLLIVFALTLRSTRGEPEASAHEYNNILKRTSIEAHGETALLVRELSFLPGWKAPTHFHNADLFIYIMKGEFEVTMDHTGRVVYSEGEAMEMRAETIMDARNFSDTDPLVLVVFQVGAPDSPFVVPVEK